ncbi:MAG: uracil-DNA glycosylase [Burkholderiales bacterium 24-55-52]|jgi:hypothetical protein|nr:MAG: uracil-DNA glycosylase [Burkholderiales bacterium 24-55-52]OZB48451.1 MAG: uracil-DNA glycosylase [Polynucleobacter sp. 39-45-136]
MNPTSFVRALAAITLENVFNPYSDNCAIHDKSDAATTRRKNLLTYLSAAQTMEVDTIWMGRDLGYRGGRRTGLALTDECHLIELEKLFPGATLSRATNGSAVAERTAAEIWAALRVAPRPPLFWNVFPFHPHEQGSSLTNRRFTAKELAKVDDLNASLIAWLGVKRVISIGQDAYRYAKQFGVEVQAVRHPSYGGVMEFRRGIAGVYGHHSVHSNHTEQQGCLFATSL